MNFEVCRKRVKYTLLTEREKQVICLVSYSNKKISSILGIGHQTVKNHLYHIGRTLGLQNGSRAAIVVRALELGEVTLVDIEVGDYRTEEKEVNWYE